MKFHDRVDAGRKLALKLKSYQGKKDALILAIPRGGVIVAGEIARRLKLPLDVVIIRKIGHPANPELAIGAVGSAGTVFLNRDLLKLTGLQEEDLKDKIQNLKKEIERREKILRSDRKPFNIKNKIVIITDDGMATGSTMEAAILTLKKQKPKQIIIAVPVASKSAFKKILKIVDQAVALLIPEHFDAVGEFYENFAQVIDEEVIKILNFKE